MWVSKLREKVFACAENIFARDVTFANQSMLGIAERESIRAGLRRAIDSACGEVGNVADDGHGDEKTYVDDSDRAGATDVLTPASASSDSGDCGSGAIANTQPDECGAHAMVGADGRDIDALEDRGSIAGDGVGIDGGDAAVRLVVREELDMDLGAGRKCLHELPAGDRSCGGRV